MICHATCFKCILNIWYLGDESSNAMLAILRILKNEQGTMYVPLDPHGGGETRV